jgi:hypothetical protein
MATPPCRSHRMCTYLMSIHIEPRPVYLVRPGHVEKLAAVGHGLKSKPSGPRFLSHMDSVQSLGGSMQVLYCTVLYCTVLYCTVLYCTVLYCTVLYCTVLYCLYGRHACLRPTQHLD